MYVSTAFLKQALQKYTKEFMFKMAEFTNTLFLFGEYT